MRTLPNSAQSDKSLLGMNVIVNRVEAVICFKPKTIRDEGSIPNRGQDKAVFRWCLKQSSLHFVCTGMIFVKMPGV